MQSQTKHELLKVLDEYHQILLKENMKAAPDKSHFFSYLCIFVGHIIAGKTITPIKSRIDAILRLQLPSNKKRNKNFLEFLTSCN